MAEYLIQDTTLTNLGNSIRTLDGTTATLSPAEMKANLDTFNTELGEIASTQDTLIADIITALEGKSAGGDSGNGTTIETVTVTIDFYEPLNPYLFFYEDGNGTINMFEANPSVGSQVFNIRKNSMVVFHCPKLADNSASIKVGLAADILSSSGIEIMHILVTTNSSIIDAVCKVTKDLEISFAQDDWL